MLSLQVFLLFAAAKVFSLTCDKGYTWDDLTISISTTCSSSYTSCGIINETYSYNGEVLTYTETSAKFDCANSTLCSIYAGGVDSCSKVSYNYYEWYPTGRCSNGTADGVNISNSFVYYYACCQTDKCIASLDYSTCTLTSTYQNYISAINTCWNKEYQNYVNDMYCQHDHLYNYSLSCTTNGTWNGNNDSASLDSSCYYQATCSSDLIAILQDLADCACTATNTYDYNITVLQDELSSYYSAWCPNVAVTCNGNSATLEVTYYYIKWSFTLDVAYSDVNGNETIQALIKADVATNAKADSSSIDLVFTSSSSRRNLLSSSSTTVAVTITTEDSASASTVQNNVNKASPTTVGGYTVSSSSSATTTSSTSQYNSSDAKMLTSGMIFAIIVMIATLLN